MVAVFLPDLVSDTHYKTVALDPVRCLYEANVVEGITNIPAQKSGKVATVEIKVSVIDC